MAIILRYSDGSQGTPSWEGSFPRVILMFTSLGMVFLGWLMADRALTGLSMLGSLVSIQTPCLVDSEPKHHLVLHAPNISHMVCHRVHPGYK
ncbi:hypothetical protein BDW59DRAFT_104650 [Aspergillus cavernicola]|uniref:Uncharacterized protein n=1 Tax=Aspergillus cavernicola TaxID=176166 RepID=A0ABR4IXD6_9EURO